MIEVIQRSVDYLAKRGVENPRLQVELLLAHLLAVPRMRLYLDFDRALTPDQLDGLRELVKRRGNREPLQHIAGSTSFCGLDLKVTRDVLVPRPETELLAEFAWEYLNSLPAAPNPPSALDFGTGSGCLAVAVAVKCPAAQVVAIDVSKEALAIARENATRHKVESRIRIREGDGFGALPGGMKFDLLVSNPPYIPSGELASLEPEVRDHDPRLALDGGADGLNFYRLLAREAGDWLKTSGRLMVEFGDGQAAELQRVFGGQNWIVEGVREDYNRKPRILVAVRTPAPGRT